MAKELLNKVKLQIPAGRATAAPPVGTALGPFGIPLPEFCTRFNDATKDKMGDSRTIEQSNYILSNIRNDIPVIIVGHVNLLPETDSIKILNNKLINLIDKYNIKSTRPIFDDGLDKGNIVCDYIFVNNKVKINNFKVIDSKVSDHLPMILDFDI